MYDSIHVELIPADATEVLAYTDGRYANATALKARFPNARLHTISAVGQVCGEWIDVERGCVWPPDVAVAKWRIWKTQGCKGFYCSTSTRPIIQSLLWSGEDPEWFEADPTGIAHIRPGDVATQYLFVGSYDESETSAEFEGDATPGQAAPDTRPLTESDDDDMFLLCCIDDGHPDYLISGERKTQITDVKSVANLQAAGVKVVHLALADYNAAVSVFL